MNRVRWGSAAGLVSACVLLLMGGCATTEYVPDETDPAQKVNRTVYDINDALDRAILKPIAEVYADYTPDMVRTSVTNFFDNLAYPNVILNDVLQGKFTQAGEDIGRFITNSTFGVAGLFDVATPMGMPSHDEDLGQTFGVWGAGEGAYLVLPVFGPNSVRDAPDLVVSTFTSVLYWADVTFFWPFTVLDLVDTRANLLGATRLRDESALDPYIFTREAYRQKREYLIYDGNPPLEDFNELEDFAEDSGAR